MRRAEDKICPHADQQDACDDERCDNGECVGCSARSAGRECGLDDPDGRKSRRSFAGEPRRSVARPSRIINAGLAFGHRCRRCRVVNSRLAVPASTAMVLKIRSASAYEGTESRSTRAERCNCLPWTVPETFGPTRSRLRICLTAARKIGRVGVRHCRVSSLLARPQSRRISTTRFRFSCQRLVATSSITVRPAPDGELERVD